MRTRLLLAIVSLVTLLAIAVIFGPAPSVVSQNPKQIQLDVGEQGGSPFSVVDSACGIPPSSREARGRLTTTGRSNEFVCTVKLRNTSGQTVTAVAVHWDEYDQLGKHRYEVTTSVDGGYPGTTPIGPGQEESFAYEPRQIPFRVAFNILWAEFKDGSLWGNKQSRSYKSVRTNREKARRR